MLKKRRKLLKKNAEQNFWPLRGQNYWKKCWKISPNAKIAEKFWPLRGQKNAKIAEKNTENFRSFAAKIA